MARLSVQFEPRESLGFLARIHNGFAILGNPVVCALL
jgi:hypothetical protein